METTCSPIHATHTHQCKADIVADDVKNAALYIPVVSTISVVWLQLVYLTGGGVGPILDISKFKWEVFFSCDRIIIQYIYLCLVFCAVLCTCVRAYYACF